MKTFTFSVIVTILLLSTGITEAKYARGHLIANFPVEGIPLKVWLWQLELRILGESKPPSKITWNNTHERLRKLEIIVFGNEKVKSIQDLTSTNRGSVVTERVLALQTSYIGRTSLCPDEKLSETDRFIAQYEKGKALSAEYSRLFPRN